MDGSRERLGAVREPASHLGDGFVDLPGSFLSTEDVLVGTSGVWPLTPGIESGEARVDHVEITLPEQFSTLLNSDLTILPHLVHHAWLVRQLVVAVLVDELLELYTSHRHDPPEGVVLGVASHIIVAYALPQASGWASGGIVVDGR